MLVNFTRFAKDGDFFRKFHYLKKFIQYWFRKMVINRTLTVNYVNRTEIIKELIMA